MSENGITQAERRVREMNMMARQFNEQGNRFMQQAQSARQMQMPQNASPRGQQTARFEPMGQNGTYNAAAVGAGNGTRVRTVNAAPVRDNAPTEPKDVQREVSPADINSLFSGFNMDGEKLMIILIMYILIKEKADIKLILALGYLLL